MFAVIVMVAKLSVIIAHSIHIKQSLIYNTLGAKSTN